MITLFFQPEWKFVYKISTCLEMNYCYYLNPNWLKTAIVPEKELLNSFWVKGAANSSSVHTLTRESKLEKKSRVNKTNPAKSMLNEYQQRCSPMAGHAKRSCWLDLRRMKHRWNEVDANALNWIQQRIGRVKLMPPLCLAAYVLEELYRYCWRTILLCNKFVLFQKIIYIRIKSGPIGCRCLPYVRTSFHLYFLIETLILNCLLSIQNKRLPCAGCIFPWLLVN